MRRWICDVFVQMPLIVVQNWSIPAEKVFWNGEMEVKMGIVEIMIIGLVFVSLGGCLVYSLISNRQ